MTEKKPLLLVDGSSYLFRAFHALPPLSNSRGEPTGAIYGVANMLRRLLKEYEPEHIAVVFDARGKTFRDDLYKEYKANRPPMPEDLVSQIEPLLKIVQAMGLPMLQVEGVEADDVIGTLAQQASAAGMKTVISTGDKDMAQLVDDKISLVNTMTNSRLDRDGVKAKFDVWPEQIIDYLALVGDSSDNIPGVPKVGPKTAAKWLNQYNTVDEIIVHADEIGGKVGESLRANLEQLSLSRELATIRCQLQLDVTPKSLNCDPPDKKTLRELFTRLEFRTWLAEIDDGQAADTSPQRAVEYETVLDQQHFDRWLARLGKAELFAVDTETTSLNYMEAEIVGVSFSVKSGEAAYVPVAHDYAGAPKQLPRKKVLDALKPLLEDSARAKLGHHIKYDAHVFANHGIHLAGMRHDSMLESYVLDSTGSRHDMDTLAAKYLDVKTIHYEDVAGKGAKQIGFDKVALETAGPYAAEDADITLRLHQTLWPKLQAVPALMEVYERLEMPLVPVLLAMEHTGVLIDADMLHQQSGELSREMQKLEARAHELAGHAFNLGSPKQLQEILFDKLGLPVLRKTPGGQPSTAEDVLEELASKYDLPRVILDYRGLSKLKSTYTDKLPTQICKRTGRVHTSYHQAVAATGRLSSSDPNLQNIPVRSAEGRRIRQAFIAPPGYRILAADYSQIELRIMAHLSRDKRLMEAFAKGRDIHSATAAEVFETTLEAVTPEQRRAAKTINFGLIYGMSAFGLARQLDISRAAAQDYVELYFKRYPKVKAFMDDTRKQAHEQGYVSTVFGRRLYLPTINSRNAQRRNQAERAAINAPMQGTEADIIKRAMIDMHAWLKENRLDARMIMQVHDELVFEVAKKDTDALHKAATRIMSAAAELDVPLVVDVSIGKNWDEAH